ncbi:MAG: hypothetical protein ACLFV6_10950 [Spirulinaceae cyanobacterium]
MTETIQLQAVFETPDLDREYYQAWDILIFKPYKFVRLWGGMSEAEISLFIMQLADYNEISLNNDLLIIINFILMEKELVLPGGIAAISSKKEIKPSCCSGLESWREWVDFLNTEQTPWWGHDPSPWVELQGDSVRLWSDGGLYPVRKAFYLELSRSQFKGAIASVQADLQAFLSALGNWGMAKEIPETPALCVKIDHSFNITPSWGRSRP